jgi:hypothetical protein
MVMMESSRKAPGQKRVPKKEPLRVLGEPQGRVPMEGAPLKPEVPKKNPVGQTEPLPQRSAPPPAVGTDIKFCEDT